MRNDNDYRPSEVVKIYTNVAVRMEESRHLFLKLSKENAPCLVFNLNFLGALEYQGRILEVMFYFTQCGVKCIETMSSNP